MPHPPDRATFTALRATRDATRLATAILLDRVTGLAVVHCARCGRPAAAVADAAHPAGDLDGRVVCHICVRAEQVAAMHLADVWEMQEPPLYLCIDQFEEWVRAGLVEPPFERDTRPTAFEWLRRKFRRTSIS